MTTSTMILALLVSSLAVSFGWGMRGCIIGGEKGAMLPGALLGIVLAWFSGVDVFQENFWIFAAVGALTMFYGGTEPYAQTMDMISGKNEKYFNPKKGYKGLILKGALWFGICGGFLGMSFTATTGRYYEWYELVGLFVSIPFVQALGVKAFNKPYDRNKGIFPKRYFCLRSREEWGGNLFLLIEVLTFMAVKGDRLGLWMGASGIVSGALGWVIAMVLYDSTSWKRKNGGYIFGKAQEAGMIDNWKIMEYTLGAVGGFGITLAFCANNALVRQYSLDISAGQGIWNALGNKGDLFSWIALALLISVALQYIYVFYKAKGFKDGLGIDMHAIELVERPMYAVLPLMLIMLGSINMAQIISFFAIYWVLMEKMCFEITENYKFRGLVCGVYLLFATAILVGEIVLGSYTLWQTWLLYCTVYVISELLDSYRPKRVKAVVSKAKSNKGKFLQGFGSRLTVDIYFVFQATILIAVGAVMFGKA